MMFRIEQKKLRILLFFVLFCAFVCVLSTDCFANYSVDYKNEAVKTPLHYVTPRFQNVPVYLKNIAYGLAGLATLGVGALGMFGKMSWPWVGSIIGSTALISGTYYYMQFVVK